MARSYSTNEIDALAKEDFGFFVRNIIGLKNEGFHNELDSNLGNPSNKKIAISYPRGHGKSTHLSAAYPLWRMAKDHNLRILLISATSQVSKLFLSEIIGHIERNEAYQRFSHYCDPAGRGVVPRMKNYSKLKQNWSGDSIIIEREQLNLKDPTINAVGLFGAILAKRADIIIGDDIVTQMNSATEDQRQKVIDWIRTTVMPVLVPGGTFIYLGNTWHQGDLVSALLKDPQFDYTKRVPAIKHESNHPELWEEYGRIMFDESYSVAERKRLAQVHYDAHKAEMDEGVEVLWPSRFPYSWLYMERLISPYSFARMYQCDPSNRPDQSFRDEWLEAACKKGSHLKLQETPHDNMIMQLTTTGVDLAISQEDHSDDTVLLTIDKVKWTNDPKIKVGDVIVRNIIRSKLTPNQTKEAIRLNHVNLKPDGIRVESVAYQEAIVLDLDDMGIPVHGYKTGAEKKHPEIGVNALAILAEQGKLVLPYDHMDRRTIELISQLMNEMRAWPDGHTGDSLMALWFAYSEMRELQGGILVVPSMMPAAGLEERPDISVPEVRRAEEKKADIALTLEAEYERSNFQQQMGGFWKR